MKRYSHAYDIAFEVDSDDPSGATPDEVLDGLRKRLSELQAGGETLICEAVGAPYDSYDREEQK